MRVPRGPRARLFCTSAARAREAQDMEAGFIETRIAVRGCLCLPESANGVTLVLRLYRANDFAGKPIWCRLHGGANSRRHRGCEYDEERSG
jgi:hypothetical protein